MEKRKATAADLAAVAHFYSPLPLSSLGQVGFVSAMRNPFYFSQAQILQINYTILRTYFPIFEGTRSQAVSSLT
jgi:hypothetical protein